MSFADPIGDMITRIRNAQLRALHNVKIPSSKFRAKILEVLKQEGYISDYKLLSDTKIKSFFVVDLKSVYRLKNGLTGSFGINNVNDDEYFVFHPMPQRTFFFNVKWQF